jgi:tRNA G18 (ribose-2'-O)-methylase SpoU
MLKVIIIAHNIRSAHNIGSIFRNAACFDVTKLIISGYSPYPRLKDNDPRLPHVASKLTKQIHKTALGAEELVPFEYQVIPDFDNLRQNGYKIVGLEQDARAIQLPVYHPPQKVALLLGEEVDGIPIELRNQCDTLIEIPIKGNKESFNVSVATGIALYKINYP